MNSSYSIACEHIVILYFPGSVSSALLYLSVILENS
jgi:hypothetical protein